MCSLFIFGNFNFEKMDKKHPLPYRKCDVQISLWITREKNLAILASRKWLQVLELRRIAFIRCQENLKWQKHNHNRQHSEALNMALAIDFCYYSAINLWPYSPSSLLQMLVCSEVCIP